MRRFTRTATAAAALVISLGLIPSGASHAATSGDLEGIKARTSTEGSTQITIKAHLGLHVVSPSETSGYFKYYTKATSNVPMIQMCNQTIIVLRAKGRASTFRPVLTWEGPWGPVRFNHYNTRVVRDRINDFFYEATMCGPNGARKVGWSSTSGNRLAWSGAWSVKSVKVTVRNQARSSDGVVRQQVAVVDTES